MKIERSTATRGVRAVGNAAYARRVEASEAIEPAEAVAATSSVLGIPENEFTPRVRDAIMGLMGEVDNLRRELAGTRQRLRKRERRSDRDERRL